MSSEYRWFEELRVRRGLRAKVVFEAARQKEFLIVVLPASVVQWLSRVPRRPWWKYV
jgi:hypothetical protein